MDSGNRVQHVIGGLGYGHTFGRRRLVQCSDWAVAMCVHLPCQGSMGDELKNNFVKTLLDKRRSRQTISCV